MHDAGDVHVSDMTHIAMHLCVLMLSQLSKKTLQAHRGESCDNASFHHEKCYRSGYSDTMLVLCRAVSGAVLHMAAEASSVSSGGSSFGQSVVYIANSSFVNNYANASLVSDGSDMRVAAAASLNALQGTGGKVHVFTFLLDN